MGALENITERIKNDAMAKEEQHIKEAEKELGVDKEN